MNFLSKIKQWAIDNKYFFSIGSILLTLILVGCFIREVSDTGRLIVSVVTLFFCLVTYWLVQGGHYGDMNCE